MFLNLFLRAVLTIHDFTARHSADTVFVLQSASFPFQTRFISLHIAERGEFHWIHFLERLHLQGRGSWTAVECFISEVTECIINCHGAIFKG